MLERPTDKTKLSQIRERNKVIGRDEEQEPIVTIPPVVGVAVEGVQVATIIVAVETEQVQVAVRIGNMSNVSSIPPPLESR